MTRLPLPVRLRHADERRARRARPEQRLRLAARIRQPGPRFAALRAPLRSRPLSRRRRADGEDDIVHGEAVLLSDPASLAWIDEYEGYVHGAGDSNEYDRLVREVRLAGGETFDAWVYLLRRAPDARAASTAAAGCAAEAAASHFGDVESWPADPERPSTAQARSPLRPRRPAPTPAVIHPPRIGHYWGMQKHIFLCISRRSYLLQIRHTN